MKHNSEYKWKEIEKVGIEWYYLVPLLFILAIIPLIVYLKLVPLTGDVHNFWTGDNINADFFSYYKGVWLLIATITSLVVYLFILYQSKFRFFKKDLVIYYGLASIYLLFVLTSTVFSEYPKIAILGFPDHYEGVFVLTAYILIFFLTSSMISNDKSVKVLIWTLYLGSVIIGIIGVFQYLGYDLWKTNIGKSLMLPAEYESLSDQLQFQFDKYSVYATLFHRDYVGSYMSMLLPFSLSLFILSKNIKLKIVMGVWSVLMGFNLMGSNSRAGMVGGVLGLIVLIVVANKLIIKKWKISFIGLSTVILISIIINHYSQGYLFSRVTSLIVDAKSLVVSSENKNSPEDNIPLKDIEIIGNKTSIITATDQLSFEVNNQQLSFYDENNNLIETEYSRENGKIVFDDPYYENYSLSLGKIEDKRVLGLQKGEIKLIFELREDRAALVDNKGNEVNLEPVEAWGFEGNERVGSSRGYIWSRSIPLLKETVILGYGPDTFAAYFPQNDLKGKMYAYYGDMWQVVDKPHNLYLQIALNTGIISLLSVIVLFGMYIVKSLRIYFSNDFETFLARVGVSVFVAVIGYLGAAFFNDSVISVAPVFWILLGLGVSINHMVTYQGVEGEKNNCK